MSSSFSRRGQPAIHIPKEWSLHLAPDRLPGLRGGQRLHTQSERFLGSDENWLPPQKVNTLMYIVGSGVWQLWLSILKSGTICTAPRRSSPRSKQPDVSEGKAGSWNFMVQNSWSTQHRYMISWFVEWLEEPCTVSCQALQVFCSLRPEPLNEMEWNAAMS